MRATIMFLILAFVGSHGAAAAPPEDDEEDDESPEAVASAAAARQAAVAAAFSPLPELMVKSHLSKCRGVEVHRRGDGFMAGSIGGPVVLIRANVTCAETERNGQREAMIRASWSARFPDSDDEVEISSRTIDPIRLMCPVEIGAHILQELKTPPDKVCQRAFHRNWEDFGLADFFVPVLVPTGEPSLGERDGLPTLVFERDGRRFELSGRVRCMKELSTILDHGMGPKVLAADVSLIDAESRRVLGTWNEELVKDVAISCDLAFRRPLRPMNMDAARALWARRIADAIDR